MCKVQCKVQNVKCSSCSSGAEEGQRVSCPRVEGAEVAISRLCVCPVPAGVCAILSVQYYVWYIMCAILCVPYRVCAILCAPHCVCAISCRCLCVCLAHCAILWPLVQTNTARAVLTLMRCPVQWSTTPIPIKVLLCTFLVTTLCTHCPAWQRRVDMQMMIIGGRRGA